jgi:outer membrane autotransporter protein
VNKLIANIDTASFANIDKTLVQNGATLKGIGNAGTSFLFETGAFHDIRGNQATQTFQADEIRYDNGSTVYANIGSASYDKIIANAIRFNDQVNVVLFNLGNHNANVIADDLFSVRDDAATGIQLGDDGIELATPGMNANNTAQLVADNGATITFQSGSYSGYDMLVINDLLVGENGRTLGVDVTGMVYDANPPLPWDDPNLPGNTRQLANTIINNMYGTWLYSAIAANVGNDLDAFLDMAAALDPAIVSVESAAVQNNTMHFNRLIGNRIQASQTSSAGFAGHASRNTSSSIYRAQNRSGNGSTNQRMSSRYDSGLWFEGITSYTNQDSINGVTGFSGETFGFGIGYDRKLNRRFLVGMAFGGTYGRLNARQNAGTSKSDNYIGSLYGCYDTGSLSIGMSGGYASADITSQRSIAGVGYAEGKRSGNTWFASTEVAYRHDLMKVYLSPFYRFDFVGYHEDAFTETGINMPMSFSAHNENGFLQTLGLRIGTQFTNVHDWKITPEITGGWIHDYGDGEITSTAQFVQGGPAIVLDGIARIKNRALVGMGLNIAVSPKCNLFAKYDGVLASKYCSHTGQAGMYLYF